MERFEIPPENWTYLKRNRNNNHPNHAVICCWLFDSIQHLQKGWKPSSALALHTGFTTFYEKRKSFFKEMRNFFRSWGRRNQPRNHSIPLLTIETEPLPWVMSYSSPLGEALHHIVVPPPSQTEGPHLITSTATSPSASTAATQEGILCFQCFPTTPTSHLLTPSF